MKTTNLLKALLCASLLMSLTACSNSSSDKKKEVTVQNAEWCSDRLTQDASALLDAYQTDQIAMGIQCQNILGSHKASEFDCKMTYQGRTDVLRHKEVMKTCEDIQNDLAEAPSTPPVAQKQESQLEPQPEQQPSLAKCSVGLQSELNSYFTKYRRYESAKREGDEYFASAYKESAGSACNRILKRFSRFDFGCTMQIGNSNVFINYVEFRQECEDLFRK